MRYNKAELVIVPTPGIGHLVPAVEAAKLMVHRDNRLSITVLIMKLFDSGIGGYIDSLSRNLNTNRIKLILLPEDNVFSETNSPNFVTLFIESNKPYVRDAVRKLADSNSSPRVAGLLLDMFCMCMIDVANEFGLPSYVFFPSGVSFLGFMFYHEKLQDEEGKDITEFRDDHSAELEFPYFLNPLPANVLPSLVLMKDSVSELLTNTRRFKETKGIVMNTFTELESHAMKTLIDDVKNPPLYPIGPILNLKNESKQSTHENVRKIMEWLDGQPDSSVVFLCFGSMGNFNDEQVREIAYALDQSGYRFLWSLRKPPPEGARWIFPTEYSDLEVLPEGFLRRTSERGKVIGWSPQVEVLAHRAIGGFVSHCGWNSMLESLWFGVPIATWPLYSEQQFNAFLLVKELGLAVEIKMDYRRDFYMPVEQVLKREEIQRGIRSLMEESSKREKVKEISEKSHRTLLEGGSSYLNLGLFVDDIFNNIP